MRYYILQGYLFNTHFLLKKNRISDQYTYLCYKTINGATPSRAMVFLDTHKERKIVPTPMDEKSKQAVVRNMHFILADY